MAMGVEPQFYPRLFTHIDFADTNFVTIFAAGSRNRFSHVICRSNAARVFTFRQITGGATILTVATTAGMPDLVVPGWQVDSLGLEVAVNNATNSSINFFYGVGTRGAS